MSIAEIVTWFIIGLLAGYVVASLTGRPKTGTALFEVMGVGLAGALLGGFLFKFFGILPGLDTVAISLRDVVSAVTGALILLFVVPYVWKRRAGQG
jgi:uncharacterized membrane protein YeaQ/YmgE (transglycosylase-associated protein family)